MFADPLAITIDGATSSLPRVQQDGRKSIYQKNDQTLTETISHTTSNQRTRSLVKVEERKIVADPLISDKSDYDNASFQIVLERPIYGFSLAELQKIWAGIKAQMDDNFIAKIYGQES
jgi:hypothetical protein